MVRQEEYCQTEKDIKRVDGYGSESLGGGGETDGRELFKIAK